MKGIIAVDAGGTKTKIAFINRQKEIMWSTVVGSGSPAVMHEKAFIHIKDGVKQAFSSLTPQHDIAGIAMGISGFGVVLDKEAKRKEFRDEFQVPVIMENDAVIALYSIIQDQHDKGILVLSGTGTSVLGIQNEETFLVSGWGHLLNERGSAYSCVKDYIIQIIETYEETGMIPELGKKFMKTLGYQDIQDFKILMYQHTKNEVAAYSKFFSEEAKCDVEAQEWLRQNGAYLAKDVLHVMARLKIASPTVLGFRGGFISNNSFVQEGLISTLEQNHVRANIVEGEKDPIYGAFYMGLRRGIKC